MITVLGEGSGVAGTSYSLICTVRLPFGITEFPNIQWKRPNMPFTRAFIWASTSVGFTATLQLPSLRSSDAGEYLCQASYSLGGYTSPLVNDSLTLNVISKSTNVTSKTHLVYYNSPNNNHNCPFSNSCPNGN